MPLNHLTLLYRGSLSGCNYACDYCPFAKHTDSRERLAQDKQQLERLTAWVASQTRPISILFTPWGEALIRGYYRQAITELSWMPQVKKVAIQTNFSCSSQWLEKTNKEKVAFWISYHPKEINHQQFIQRCRQLDEQSVHYSVGMVGVKENFSYIAQCRQDLSQHQYLWINSYKREKNYYQPEDINFLSQIDPHFITNNQRYPSLGRPCHTGETVISVNGDGDISRCHFIKDKLGNIYNQPLEDILKPRLCSLKQCGCYIGYIHMPELKLEKVYGDSILERNIIPWLHQHDNLIE